MKDRPVGGKVGGKLPQEQKDHHPPPGGNLQKYGRRDRHCQGLPLSQILYLFFNADLIKDCHSQTRNTAAVGCIEDSNMIAWGNSAEDNCRNLEAIYAKCKDCEMKYASKFNPAKYGLIHLHTRYKGVDTTCSIRLEGLKVKPAPKCRILGVILDNKLSWRSHIDHIEAKTTKSLGALNSLAGSTSRTSYQGLRRIYQGMILPQMTYAASAWYAPLDLDRRYRDRAIRKLEVIQRKGAKIITGTFKTVAGPALNIEAHILPVRHQLYRVTAETYLRIRTTPLYQTLEQFGRVGTWVGYPSDWHNLYSR